MATCVMTPNDDRVLVLNPNTSWPIIASWEYQPHGRCGGNPELKEGIHTL